MTLGASSANAGTIFLGGELLDPANWDNGFPDAADDGTVATDGTDSTDYFPLGTYTITQTSGTITAADASDALNWAPADDGSEAAVVTYNMEGGTLTGKAFIANARNNYLGGDFIMNMSGGTIQLTDVEGDTWRRIAAGNGGHLNISGSAVLDASSASADDPNSAIDTDGHHDIASNWTGYWTHGNHTGNDWRDLFVNSGAFTYDGATINGDTFDSTFVVSDGGATLAIPEPASLGLFGIVCGALWFVRRRFRGIAS